jgi:hypothetical protein
MANTDGFLTKPNVLMYALIALVGGGSSIASNQTSDAAKEKAEAVERRVDQLEVDTAVIREKVGNIEEGQKRIEEDNKDRHGDLLEAIRELEK